MKINLKCECGAQWQEPFDAAKAQEANDKGSIEHPHPQDVDAGVEFYQVCDDCHKATLASYEA